jgi:UDP-2,3-diacylglucosamine hydrolase
MTKRRVPDVVDVADLPTPVTVVGDVHLTPEEPDVAARFTAFLDRRRSRGGTLVLLGDVFDWWIGREQAARQPFAHEILEHLQTVQAAGVRVVFLAGNRDYAFDGAAGLEVELWADVVRTRLGGRTVVFSHGDLLCSEDRGYLRMRAVFRSKPGRWLLRTLPYTWAAYVAQGVRDLSDRSTRRSRGAQLGIDYGLAAAWLDAYEADALVLGHVHTGVHHELRGPRGPRDVYVLKDWSRASNAVELDGETIALVAV